MSKRNGFSLGNIFITIGVVLLVVFGSFMIVSAEMGNAAGDSAYLTGVLVKQVLFAIFGFIAYFTMCFVPLELLYKLKMWVFYGAYTLILIMLLVCRLFGATNGAYAWIPLGPISIQPSEFAKAFMILFAARLLSRNNPKENLNNLKKFGICAGIYFVIILLYQHDLGSAMVLFVMCYCMALIVPYREFLKYQRYMVYLVLGVLILIPVILSPPFTNLLKHFSGNYMIGRFLAAADPFLYRYDSGYHIVMSLVSFANGNVFGLGYSNSIHKYMNFPNPSNDFILPVIVEELGIIGFAIILIGYALIIYPVMSFSIKSEKLTGKIVSIGVVAYFFCHFIFNVGGVSGFIPLTGVPLLIISSGGSSLIACLIALGMVQNEIGTYRRELNESNSGQI